MLAMSSGSPFLFPRLPLVLTRELEAKVKARVRKFPGHEPNRLQLAAPLLAPGLQTSLGESLESFIGPQQ